MLLIPAPGESQFLILFKIWNDDIMGDFCND